MSCGAPRSRWPPARRSWFRRCPPQLLLGSVVVVRESMDARGPKWSARARRTVLFPVSLPVMARSSLVVGSKVRRQQHVGHVAVVGEAGDFVLASSCPLPHGLHEAIAAHRSQRRGAARHLGSSRCTGCATAAPRRRGLKGLDVLGQLLERHHPLVVRQPLLRRHLRGLVELGHHTAVGGHGLLRGALHFLCDDVLSKRGGVVLIRPVTNTLGGSKDTNFTVSPMS